MNINKEKSKRILDKLETMPSGNRTIKPSVVKELRKSIQMYGILRDVVVIKTNIFGGKTRYYPADGQHLILAATAEGREDELGFKEVNYQFNSIIEIVHFVSLLNSTQSPWRLQDYIHAYASTNKLVSYNILENKIDLYGLSANLTAIIYMGESKSVVSKKIREGGFRVVDEPKGDRIAVIVGNLIELFGRTNSTALTRFASAFYHWYKDDLDTEEFYEFMEERIEDLREADEREMHTILNDFSKVKYPEFKTA